MDPITDLQSPTAEPPSHIAFAANPTPISTHPNHPPYSEMITAAIANLRDKDGSSRQAIAKYIEKVYTNLPPTHSSLLTHHLKRLKNNGQLVMNKHSYMLPTGSGSLDFSATGNLPPPLSPSGSKRKPGRPPKPRQDVPVQFQVQPDLVPGSEAQAYSAPQEVVQAYSVTGPDGQQYSVAAPQGGYPVQGYSVAGPEVQGYSVGGTEPMFVSLGLADEPTLPQPQLQLQPQPTASVGKRGRGRPPKGVNGSVARKPSRGSTVLGKRGRGRPPRPKLLSDIMNNGGGPKKSTGRLRTGPGPATVPFSDNVFVPKQRGRPKVVVTSRPKTTGRARGRPSRNLAAEGGGVDGFMVPIPVSTRRPGRPSKGSNGKALGGLNKGSSGTAVIVTDPRELVAYQELMSKLELFQSTIKQAVNVVKPCLNTESGIDALGALQELEALATMDVSAPLHVRAQEPPPPLP